MLPVVDTMADDPVAMAGLLDSMPELWYEQCVYDGGTPVGKPRINTVPNPTYGKPVGIRDDGGHILDAVKVYVIADGQADPPRWTP
jgi:hypothetical protein